MTNFCKRKTLQSAKITTLPKLHIQFCRTLSFVHFFDFRYLFCGGCYNPKSRIAYTVEQRVKLPPLRVLFGGLIQKKLVYRYIVTEHKFKENLQTGVLPVILYIRKVAGRDKHFVAYFLAALFPARSRCLYRCSKSLEVVLFYLVFSPYSFTQLHFTVPLFSWICLHIS